MSRYGSGYGPRQASNAPTTPLPCFHAFSERESDISMGISHQKGFDFELVPPAERLMESIKISEQFCEENRLQLQKNLQDRAEARW